MYSHATKKRRSILLYVTYVVMGAMMLILSVITLLYVTGYRFDFADGEFEQGALLQYRSSPSNSNVLLNGTDTGLNTPDNQNVDAGEHQVGFRKQEYRDWNKTFSVKKGELLWLNYARMIPRDVTTQNVIELDGYENMLASPDRRRIAIQTADDSASLLMVDIGRDSLETDELTLSDPTEIPAPSDATYSLQEWSSDSDHLLISRKNDGKTEYILIDRTGETPAVNINRVLGLDFSAINFIGGEDRMFYALINGDLRKLDLGNKTVTAPLLRDVERMSLYRQDVVAVTDDQDSWTISTYVDDELSEVASYPKVSGERAPLVAYSSFYRKTYVSVAYQGALDLYQDPDQSIQQAVEPYVQVDLNANAAQQLSFSGNGRFVTAATAEGFVTYDIETKQASTSSEPLARNPAGLNRLDDYYLTSFSNGRLRTIEFDGGNMQLITGAASGNSTLSRDGDYLYSIAENDERFSLQRSLLVLE